MDSKTIKIFLHIYIAASLLLVSVKGDEKETMNSEHPTEVEYYSADGALKYRYTSPYSHQEESIRVYDLLCWRPDNPYWDLETYQIQARHDNNITDYVEMEDGDYAIINGVRYNVASGGGGTLIPENKPAGCTNCH